MADMLGLFDKIHPGIQPVPLRGRRRRKAEPQVHVPVAEWPLLAQVRLAGRSANQLGTTFGFILGSAVPLTSFTVVHGENLSDRPWLWLIVAAGALFSWVTVFQFGAKAFGSQLKGAAFGLLLELGMLGTTLPWLSYALLAVVATLNGVQVGTLLSVDYTRFMERRRGTA